MIAASVFAPYRARAARQGPALPNRTEAAAVERGERLGIGSVRLEGQRSVEVLSNQTFRLVYTAGPAGIRPGGALRLAMRHLQRQVALPQTHDPTAANYVTARADGGVPVLVEVPAGWKEFMTEYFAWQNIIQVTLLQQGLQPGRQIVVTLGDRSGGGPGLRIQPYDETHYAWKCFADVTGEGEYLPLATQPAIEVVAAAPYRVQVVTPSDAVVGEPTWCIARVEDRYGNPTPRLRGVARLRCAESAARLPAPHEFSAQDGGVFRFQGIRFLRPGIERIEVHVVGSQRGPLRAVSNPVRVAATPPAELLLWGDLHGHTLLSDGRGTMEEFYDFAQHVAGLDFCAATDHAFQIVDDMWVHSKAVTNRRNRPGQFITFNAYEWSGQMADGGDHNVYFLADDPPIYRSTLMYDPRNLQMDHDDAKVETVAELMTHLAAHLADKNVLCIPHWGGRHGNPRWHDPRVQRLIEIFSDHRRSEAWANTFLAAGHRVGIMASSDNHYGNPGYGYLKIQSDWDKHEIGTSAMAVFAPARTRQAIFHALYQRRTYATSGPRIIVDFRANGQPMGSVIQTHRAPTITVHAVGTAPIVRVEIKKNGQIAHAVACDRNVVDLDWQDPTFAPQSTRYYYARIVQADGEEAVSSPIWVN